MKKKKLKWMINGYDDKQLYLHFMYFIVYNLFIYLL